mgnify:CR=1 FL=1
MEEKRVKKPDPKKMTEAEKAQLAAANIIILASIGKLNEVLRQGMSLDEFNEKARKVIEETSKG